MKDKPHRGIFIFHPLKQVIPFHPYPVFFSMKIQFLFFIIKLVHENKVFVSFSVEITNHATTYKTGCTGYNDQRFLIHKLKIKASSSLNEYLTLALQCTYIRT